jgi:hypothetical protein
MVETNKTKLGIWTAFQPFLCGPSRVAWQAVTNSRTNQLISHFFHLLSVHLAGHLTIESVLVALMECVKNTAP